MRPTVLLFDLDGTLVLTGGAGRRSLERAFEEVTGRRDALDGFQFSGRTDPLIARTGLTRAGMDDSDANIARVLDAYLDALPEEVAASDHYRVLPGVVPLLQAAQAAEGLALGLGTGNVSRGARIKLARGDVDRFFTFGGYGSDAEDRAAILQIGAARGAATLGVATSDCRVVVIGDTPHDVTAALAIGAECVGVATGEDHDVAALRASGAHHALEDLTDPAARQALWAAQ